MVGPKGHRCESTAEAFDVEAADAHDKACVRECAELHKFVCEANSEKREIETNDSGEPVDDNDVQGCTAGRKTVTTNFTTDFLWRGDHPIVKHMPIYVYAMHVHRVEKDRQLKDDGQPMEKPPDYVEFDFSPDYKLYTTHRQRITPELRVPMFQGYLMSPSTVDSESAAMFKSLLLRPFSVEPGDEPEDVRFDRSFQVLSQVEGEVLDGNQAAGRKEATPTSLRQQVSPLRFVFVASFSHRHRIGWRWDVGGCVFPA